MNDIADPVAARTAAGVNATHSSDATLIHRFHLWGRDNNVPTSGVHDAFVANAARMLQARKALRELYADSLKANVFRDTLDEMRRRGLPDDLYHKYMEEAIDTGLIPVAGRSVVNGKVMTEADILKREDILKEIKDDFTTDRYFYGVG